MKKALLLCASHNDLGLLRALKKLGFYIIVTGNRDNAPGEKWADKWIKADYSNQELILRIAREEGIHNIFACCNDFGVYTAAYVAEKLGLPGYDSYETTLTLNNKDLFKKFASEHNIMTPKSHGYATYEDALEGAKKLELPLIVKPVDASAGNGVSKVELDEELEEAIVYAFAKSKAGRIVIEPFIEGSQHGFCTYLINQKVVAFCSNNEYSIVNPYRVEIDTYPADNWELCSPILIEQIEKIAEILHLKDGIFHLQYIYKDGKPWILEVMRRVLGNMYSVPANQLNGFDWDYWEIKARCGLDCSNFPRKQQQEGWFAYKTVQATRNGTIQKIRIPENYDKYIYDQFFLMKEGDTVEAYEKEPIGFLFMMFSSAEEMKRVLIDEYRSDLVTIV